MACDAGRRGHLRRGAAVLVGSDCDDRIDTDLDPLIFTAFLLAVVDGDG
jgi:hypothetical protein